MVSLIYFVSYCDSSHSFICLGRHFGAHRVLLLRGGWLERKPKLFRQNRDVPVQSKRHSSQSLRTRAQQDTLSEERFYCTYGVVVEWPIVPIIKRAASDGSSFQALTKRSHTVEVVYTIMLRTADSRKHEMACTN